MAPSFEDTVWYRNAKVRVWLWIIPTFQFKSEEKSKSVLHGVPKSLIGPQNEKNLVFKRKHYNLLNDYCTPNSNKKMSPKFSPLLMRGFVPHVGSSTQLHVGSWSQGFKSCWEHSNFLRFLFCNCWNCGSLVKSITLLENVSSCPNGCSPVHQILFQL